MNTMDKYLQTTSLEGNKKTTPIINCDTEATSMFGITCWALVGKLNYAKLLRGSDSYFAYHDTRDDLDNAISLLKRQDTTLSYNMGLSTTYLNHHGGIYQTYKCQNSYENIWVMGENNHSLHNTYYYNRNHGGLFNGLPVCYSNTPGCSRNYSGAFMLDSEVKIRVLGSEDLGEPFNNYTLGTLVKLCQ